MSMKSHIRFNNIVQFNILCSTKHNLRSITRILNQKISLKSKQPASQVISTQEAKPVPVKASKAEVTTANANKTAQDNLVDYKQLQAQPKVFENASQAQKQYFSLEMQLNHLKQLEASRKITKYRAFTCYLCQYQFATLQDLHYHFLQQYKSHPIHHFMNHYYGQITTHINELQEKLKQCYICDQCGHFTSNEVTHSSHLTNCMYQHQQLRWEVAQDNQGNQPTNQNTNQQPNSQQQGQQSKQNKQPTIRFITAGKRQDQNDENPGGNMLKKLLDDFEKNTLRRVELTKKCNDEEKYWIERKGKYFCQLYKENKNNALNFLNQFLGQFVKMHTPKVDTYEYSPAKQKQYTERMVVRHIETFRAVGRASDQINRDAAGERYEPISEEERIIQNNIHFPQNKPIAEIQLTTSQDKVLKPATEDLQTKQVKDQIQSLQWFKADHPASAHCTSCMPQEHLQKHLFNGQQTRSTSQKRENNLAQGIIFSNSKLLTFLKNLRERKNGIEVSVQVKQSYKYFINCLNDSQIVRLLTTTDNIEGQIQSRQVYI
ncbi:Hypothetical_protein [Hexamita inflata]|uniref:Hypothetical_protein n=1 Tax=Hexamita inflata TaxID=28002 RepID=A0AA86QXV2_9EUKA|nr:Hypothetical protein HINF_LOCUS55671 [Hexamita inflata]